MIPAVSSPRLSATSFIVLGLLERAGSGTPYDLKQAAQISTNNFWTVPHTQIYTECARLTELGLLSEQREETGRRRRVYSVTDEGRRRLELWRSGPTDDASILKLFFGADPETLAAEQIDAHGRQLAGYEELIAHAEVMTDGQRLALEYGIDHERQNLRFWRGLLRERGAAPG